MIILDNLELKLTKSLLTNYSQTRVVVAADYLAIPSDRRVALFCNQEDRRVFVNLIGGLVRPTSGHIVKKANVSYPVGHLGGFEPKLPIRSNVEHLARIYNADVKTMVDFVERAAELGSAFERPFGLLESSQKRNLGYITAYCLPFDCYVLTSDDVMSSRMRNSVASSLFHERHASAGMIIPTNNPKFAREYCDMGLILRRGRLRLFDEINRALAINERELQLEPVTR